MKHIVRILPLVALASLLWAPFAPAQQVQGPPPEKPLTLEQLLALVENGVSPLDIQIEVEKRQLGFIVSNDVITRLRNLGVPKQRIADMSVNSLPLAPDVNLLAEHVLQERYDRVIEQANVVMAKSPASYIAVWLRGFGHLKNGNLAEAANDFQQLADESPKCMPDSKFVKNSAHPAVMLARTHRLSKQPAKSVSVVSAFLDEFPSEPLVYSAYLERGLAYADLQDFHSARSDFVSSLKNTPSQLGLIFTTANAKAVYAKRREYQARQFEVYLTIANTVATWGSPRDRDAASARTIGLAAGELANTPANLSESLAAVAAAEAESGNFDAAISVQQRAMTGAAVSRVREFEDRLASYRRNEKPWSAAANPGGTSGPSNNDVRADLFASLVRIEGGKFRMGSDDGGPDEKPAHEASVATFLLGRHEVTRRQWRAIMGDAPSGNDDLPIDSVSWSQCQHFLERLNRELEDKAPFFRLPGEAEWEFAARGGTASRFHFGDSPDRLKEYGWCAQSPDFGSRPVGQKMPNPLGLFDIYGNVAEWCADDYLSYDQVSRSTSESQLKVLRGGSWTNSPQRCTSSARAPAPSKERRRGWGLRLAADDRPFPKIKPPQAPAGQPAAPASSLLDLAAESLADDLQEVGIYFRNIKRLRLAQLLTIRAYALHDEKNFPEALESLRNARELIAESNSVAAWQLRCLAAWIQATSADGARPTYNPRAATEAAQTAVGETEFKHWLPYTVQAAAEAELGNYEKAVTRARQALAQVPPKFREDCQRRLSDYQSRRASRGEDFPWSLNLIGLSAAPTNEDEN